jgi:ribosome-binding protein aMBF1 (putative translation factor)
MFTKKKTAIQIHSQSPELSAAIKQCRIRLDMSPQEFAKKIRKTAEYVHELEQAEIAINTPTLEDCASAFGLSVGELVGQVAVPTK